VPRRVRRSPLAGLVGLALLVVLVLVAVIRGGSGSSREPLPTTGTPALVALAGLVTSDTGAPGYDRDAFGPAWTDTDRNGCDTRNDVLARDLQDVTFRPGTRDCVVLTGRLTDPYSGVVVAVARGDGQVEIDHVVALADAWRSGAATWGYAKRLALANDPLELLAATHAVNQAKGDRDASQWLPATESGRCVLAVRVVAVKAKYGLSVTSSERAALADVLSGCPSALPSSAVPTEAPNRSPAPRPDP
jgi:hypothetical protein